MIDSADRYDLDRLSSLGAEPRTVMLFIDAQVPAYDVAAGYFIIQEYLKIFLRNGYKILYWPFNRIRIEPYSSELERMGIEVIHGDIAFADFMAVAGRHLDIAFVCRPEIAAAHMDDIRRSSDCRVLYFAHDLHFLRQLRQAELSGSEEAHIQAMQTKAQEITAMRKADISLLLSESEIPFVQAEDRRIRAAAVPWIQPVDPAPQPGFDERRGIVFLGGFLHAPNVDAVKWFHDEVFPLIRETGQGIGAVVIGSHMPPEVEALAGADDFQIAGYAPDLDEPLRRARVFVCPLRFGAGIKGKIAMAESYGLPVVTTTIGAEGMGLVDGRSALIADDARSFAEKTIELHSNRDLWERISAGGLRHVKDNYSPQTAERVIMGIIEGLESSRSGWLRRLKSRCGRSRQTR